MINLLPIDQYKELHAARHNVLLFRLFIAAAVCLTGVLFMIVSTYLLITAQEKTALAAKQAAQQQLGKYAEVEKDTKDFQKNLQTAQQILDQSVSYRTMLINIAQTLPQDATISSLQLSPETVGATANLDISTTSYERAVQLKDILNQSAIAENVSISGITAAPDDSSAPASKYPISVQMNVTFTKDLLTPTWLDKDDK